MPCRDYDYNDSTGIDESYHKSRVDELSRIACTFAKALEEGKTLDWMLLKNDKRTREAVAWWEKHKKADAAEKERRSKEQQRREMKKAALAKLTPEERRILGV